jgi:hypothetical protein
MSAVIQRPSGRFVLADPGGRTFLDGTALHTPNERGAPLSSVVTEESGQIWRGAVLEAPRPVKTA